LNAYEQSMDFKTRLEIGLIGLRLRDDAYLVWEAAEFEAGRALRSWIEGVDGQQAAYQAYRAAVDREEAAARDVERLGDLTRACAAGLVADE
jgi:hypothetical protein